MLRGLGIKWCLLELIAMGEVRSDDNKVMPFPSRAEMKENESKLRIQALLLHFVFKIFECFVFPIY